MKRTLMTLALTLGLSGVVLPLAPAHAAGAVQFRYFRYNAPSPDTSANSSVNGEYLVLRNVTSRAVTLSRWTVRDNQRHVYTFGTFTLGPSKTVVLHTGKGANTASVRYWGLGHHVWNNPGDKAYLRTPRGTTIDTCAWSSTGSGALTC